jgi:hypothetical protein
MHLKQCWLLIEKTSYKKCISVHVWEKLQMKAVKSWNALQNKITWNKNMQINKWEQLTKLDYWPHVREAESKSLEAVPMPWLPKYILEKQFRI